jgi:hypothetical protein
VDISQKGYHGSLKLICKEDALAKRIDCETKRAHPGKHTLGTQQEG